MNITPLNSSIVFSSKRKESQRAKRQADKNASHPYSRYQQKQARVKAEHLQALGINITKPEHSSIKEEEYPINSYNRKGKLISSVNKLDDGTVIAKHYDESGNMTYATKQYPSGRTAQWYFDENGKIISWDEKKPNGSRLTHYYDENGKMFVLVSKNNEETHVRKYNDQGKLTGETFLSQDGEMTTAKYNQGPKKNETHIEVLGADGESRFYDTKLIWSFENLFQDN